MKIQVALAQFDVHVLDNSNIDSMRITDESSGGGNNNNDDNDMFGSLSTLYYAIFAIPALSSDCNFIVVIHLYHDRDESVIKRS